MRDIIQITISRDGDQWCALVGPNPQEGVAGFGDTIKNALINLAMTLTSSDIDRFTRRYL